jgi:hypothetical protein
MRGCDLVMTNAIGKWWNLQTSSDTKEAGKVGTCASNVLAGTNDRRGPRGYYFKCGVCSRDGSDKSEVCHRHIKVGTKPEPAK